MLKMMRSHKFFSVFFLGFVTIAITIVFVFWGIGPQQNTSDVIIAQIDNDRLTLSEFERAYELAYRRAREIYKDPEEIEGLNLRKTVLEELVNNKVLIAAARDAGLEVREEELQAVIMSESAFHRNGVFDRNVYERRLQLMRMTPSMFEFRMKNELLVDKIRRLIGETASLSVDDMRILQALDGQDNEQIKNALLSAKKEVAVRAYIEGLKRRMDIEINERFI